MQILRYILSKRPWITHKLPFHKPTDAALPLPLDLTRLPLSDRI